MSAVATLLLQNRRWKRKAVSETSGSASLENTKQWQKKRPCLKQDGRDGPTSKVALRHPCCGVCMGTSAQNTYRYIFLSHLLIWGLFFSDLKCVHSYEWETVEGKGLVRREREQFSLKESEESQIPKARATLIQQSISKAEFLWFTVHVVICRAEGGRTCRLSFQWWRRNKCCCKGHLQLQPNSYMYCFENA